MTELMTSHPAGFPDRPTRIGQGTAVEQSRAVAEVQAAIVVAQQCPRNVQLALVELEQSCKQTALAERAFYRFPRAGGAVTGPSVHLARELARCWGNVQYGLVEMRRDDEFAQSEMQAYAWDVQTNTRNSSTFVVPHKRDTKDGAKTLTDMRDIYENNANNGARRVREAIFAILPPWFVEKAKELCSQTLRDGGGVPLPQRIANAIRVYEGVGVTTDQLEQKLGRASGKWTEHDVAQLGITFKSIQRGEITVDEEFPAPRQTLEEISKPAPKRAPKQDAAQPEEELLPHEWTLEKVAEALGMDNVALEQRCQGVTGGSLAEATEAQLRSIMQELANEMVAQDNARGGAR